MSPRIRTVKPEFFEDEDLGMLSRDARLLFVATWTLADDEGLLRWTAPYLKAGAFMYDDDVDVEQVQEMMDELVKAELLFPYRGGKSQQRLGWIVNFRRHQKINRPSPGRLPPPSIQNPDVLAAYCRRDRWVCGVCGEPLAEDPAERAGVHKQQPSLDHIKPRSKGGEDYPSNIRLAHQACNASRGAKNEDSVSDYVRQGVSHSGSGSVPEQGTGNREQGTGNREDADASSVEPGLDPVDQEAREDFAYWQKLTGHNDAKLTRERLKHYRARRREGYTRPQCRRGIEGAGTPDARAKDGTLYDDFRTVFRNGTNLEMYIGFANEHGSSDEVSARLVGKTRAAA